MDRPSPEKKLMQARGLRGNSNSEIRSTKQIQSTKSLMFETKPQGLEFWSFEFGTLEIVSDFVLRISDFRTDLQLIAIKKRGGEVPVPFHYRQ
jgi:hypothetical protein